MDAVKAAERSMRLARRYSECFSIAPESCGLDHLEEMLETMQANMSEGKAFRWLGWMQASIVFACYPYVTLADMKEINRTSKHAAQQAITAWNNRSEKGNDQ